MTDDKIYKNNEIIQKLNGDQEINSFAFVNNHENGHDYLICGSKNGGKTFYELDTNKIYNYPEIKNFDTIWKSIHPSPDGKMLAVVSDNSEIYIYDFSNPVFECYPIELYHTDEYDKFKEWIKNDSEGYDCVIGTCKEYLKDGDVAIDDLSYDVLKTLDCFNEEGNYTDNVEERWTTLTIRVDDSLWIKSKEIYQYYLEHSKIHGSSCHPYLEVLGIISSKIGL